MQEAANQAYAHRHVDRAILYVSQVFHFFEAHTSGVHMGFIVMEYGQRVSLSTLDVFDYPNRVHLHAGLHRLPSGRHRWPCLGLVMYV